MGELEKETDFFFFFYILTEPCSMWDLSFPTRGRTYASYSVNGESRSLDHQGSPLGFFFFFPWTGGWSWKKWHHEIYFFPEFPGSTSEATFNKKFLESSYSAPQQRLSYELEKCRLCPSVRQCKWLEYVGSFGKLAMRKTINLIIYPGISLESFQFIPQWNPLWLHSCSHPRERG